MRSIWEAINSTNGSLCRSSPSLGSSFFEASGDIKAAGDLLTGSGCLGRTRCLGFVAYGLGLPGPKDAREVWLADLDMGGPSLESR